MNKKMKQQGEESKQRLFQEKIESSNHLITCRHYALTQNLRKCLDLKQQEAWLAAVLIQTIVRRKFSYSEVEIKRYQRDECKKIQRRIRGMQGRKLARETLWKKLAVAPNPYALKLLRLRCKELETVGKWTEMFDPVTKLFWYYNKNDSFSMFHSEASFKEKSFIFHNFDDEQMIEMPYTCWEPPDEFRSQLTCHLINNKCSPDHHSSNHLSELKTSSKICGKKFSDRNHYNIHRLVDHAWYCNVCFSENSGINITRCFACNSTFDSSENDSITSLETDMKKVMFSLKREIGHESDHRSGGIDYISKSIDHEPELQSNNTKHSSSEHFKPYGEYPKPELETNITPKKEHIYQIKNEGTSHLRLERELKVCKRFLAGSCKSTVCPLAHPGLRDNAKKRQSKQGKQEDPYVTICLQFLNSGECAKGRECTMYHPYKRPPTNLIIREVYPLRTGPRRKKYSSGTIIDGNVTNDIFQGYGLMFWPSGESFSGMFQNGLRHGTGIWIGNDGKKFMGSWANGLRSGWGTYTVDNQFRYKGFWKDGKFHGIGSIESINGDIYEGEFKNGVYYGLGRFHKRNGDMFIGRTKSAVAYGPGILKLANGELYRGYFTDNKRCGNGICVYPNGSKYIGLWENGEHSGRGYFNFNGETYSGNWENGKKHGFGIYKFKNRDVYEGNFSGDYAHGIGTYRYFDDKRHIYHGEWVKDKKHGIGTYYWSNGSSYHGQWLSNRMEGKGVLICSSGAKYRGQFSRNQKHGQGTLEWPNGNQYHGNFEKNQICGEGTMKYLNGDKYCGEWKMNKRDGTGTFHYRNGDLYVGEFDNGTRHGRGKLIIFPNTTLEEIYDGQWHKDQRHGVGTYIYSKNHEQFIRYDGQWDHGRRHGQGVLYLRDGGIYNGSFVNDCQDGPGIFTDKRGTRYKGRFKGNKYHGEGTLNFDDGSTYIGEFIKNKREGKGTLIYTSGHNFTGIWNNNKAVGKGVFGFSHETKEIRLKTYGY